MQGLVLMVKENDIQSNSTVPACIQRLLDEFSAITEEGSMVLHPSEQLTTALILCLGLHCQIFLTFVWVLRTLKYSRYLYFQILTKWQTVWSWSDASVVGIVVVLTQGRHPIAYFSVKLADPKSLTAIKHILADEFSALSALSAFSGLEVNFEKSSATYSKGVCWGSIPLSDTGLPIKATTTKLPWPMLEAYSAYGENVGQMEGEILILCKQSSTSQLHNLVRFM